MGIIILALIGWVWWIYESDGQKLKEIDRAMRSRSTNN